VQPGTEVDVDRHRRLLRHVPEATPALLEDRLHAADLRLGRVADDGTAVPELDAALELRGRGARVVRGNVGQHDQAVGVVLVELGRPVVVDLEARDLELGVVDAESRRRRPVDHVRVDPVAVHVLEPLLGLARAEAEVPGRQQARRLAAVGRERAPLGLPPLAVIRLDDARPAFAQALGQPLLPEFAGQHVEVHVVVGRDELLVGGQGHGGLLSWDWILL
jgi:hypothetical protein